MKEYKSLLFLIPVFILIIFLGRIDDKKFQPTEGALGQQTIVNPNNPPRIGAQAEYPNPLLTPGLADTLNTQDLLKLYSGQTYSQFHRNVPQSEKYVVLKEYGYDIKNHIPLEIDHFYPLCAGGSNNIKNLWAEPESSTINGIDWGFHKKDKLETYVCEQIKKKKLDPQTAFDCIVNDWIACYSKYIK